MRVVRYVAIERVSVLPRHLTDGAQPCHRRVYASEVIDKAEAVTGIPGTFEEREAEG